MEINFSVKTNIPNVPQRLDSALKHLSKEEKINSLNISLGELNQINKNANET